MKHWSVLNNLDTQIVRVSEFTNLFNLVLYGVENGATDSEIQTGLFTLQGMLEDINDKLYPAFQNVWDNIREESISPKFDEDGENYNFKPLEDVVNSWIKQ